MFRKIFRVVSAAKQYHGFEYEQKVIKQYKLLKSQNYTSPYDAHHGSLNVQVKCIQHGSSVEFGDYMRNKNKSSNFILIVGFWKNEKDNIIQEHIFDVNAKSLTNNLFYPHDPEMFAEMKVISNSYEDDTKWKSFCSKHRIQWSEYGNNMDLRFRRDHKKQKRIQCGISWKNYNVWFMEEMKQYSHDEFCHLLQL